MPDILNIHWGFSTGGVARYACMTNAVQDIAPVSLDNLVILSPQWQTDRALLQGIDHTEISISSRKDISWIRRVAVEIKRRKPDVIMTHGFNGHFVYLVCSRIMKRPPPLICSYHGLYHPVHPVTVFSKALGSAYNNTAEHVIRRHSVGVVAVADFCRDYLVKKHVSPIKIEVIHNGIEDTTIDQLESRNRIREELGIREPRTVIGTASRLDPVKGISFLIKAFATVAGDFPDARLVIVGDGTEKRSLERLSSELGISQSVIFTGRRDDIEECMSAFDIFALPSLAEYHSIGLLEAMRAGLPVIATDVGGNCESVRDGKEGLIVPPADSGAIEDKLRLMLSDPVLRRKLGSSARKRFEEKFTVDVMVRRTADWMMRMGDLAKRTES